MTRRNSCRDTLSAALHSLELPEELSLKRVFLAEPGFESANRVSGIPHRSRDKASKEAT
jgi:hypothetical protein